MESNVHYEILARRVDSSPLKVIRLSRTNLLTMFSMRLLLSF